MGVRVEVLSEAGTRSRPSAVLVTDDFEANSEVTAEAQQDDDDADASTPTVESMDSIVPPNDDGATSVSLDHDDDGTPPLSGDAPKERHDVSDDTVGIMLVGQPAAICSARKALCDLAGLADTLTVDRLMRSRCRFLGVIESELAVVNALWVGRRVMDRSSGDVAEIESVRLSPDTTQIITELKLNRSESMPRDAATPAAGAFMTTEVAASDLIVWDKCELPDTISVLHRDLGNDELTHAFLRRTFRLCGPIESTTIVRTITSKKLAVSTVRFDISHDPGAPAEAVARLHGVLVGVNNQVYVTVSCPSAHVQVGTTTCGDDLVLTCTWIPSLL